MREKLFSVLSGEKTVGRDIKAGDLTEFYYTVSNINYDAFYQRYRFHVEDGKYKLFHETRERKNDYGPATEEDRTAMGDIELTPEQWNSFFELVSGGTVKKRSESADSGDSGPWMYMYWSGDRSVYQEYSFPSYERQREFAAFCKSIAESPR